MEPGIGSLMLISALALLQGMRPPNPPHSASFKDVAQRGGALILARCRTDGQEVITCTALEAWRGEMPGGAMVVSREDWARFAVGGLERRSDARFLMVVDPKGLVACAVKPPASGGGPRNVANGGTCVVPILEGRLPREFRGRYDGSKGPPLPVEELKADLLTSPRAPFLDLVRHSVCADWKNRLFVIDDALVFWDRAGNCPDNSYGATLYGNTPDDVLCYVQDSIAGAMKRCPVPRYRDMFEIIIGHPDEPDLGLGSHHTVERLAL